jgi:hypothetical protein
VSFYLGIIKIYPISFFVFQEIRFLIGIAFDAEAASPFAQLLSGFPSQWTNPRASVAQLGGG